MWLSTHYFSGLLQDWFHVFLYEIKKNSVWYNFYHGTSVSITFYIFEHYQLWMMDSKGQRVFFPKTPQLCVWHTEVRRCYHFKLVSHFQLWFPIWGVLVNRLRMFQTVVLATPNVFAISLMGLFCFFSLMMACFTDSDSSLDLILTVDSNRFQMQIAHLKWTLDLLSAHCNWDNVGITHTWPWNSWEANCSITFGPLTSGRHICKLL